MERILVISDTHGRLTNLETVLKKSGPFDRILHLGDAEGGEKWIQQLASCPLEIIAGNNDFWTSLPREKELQIGTYRIFMTHGHRYHVHYSLELLAEEACRRDCQIAMFGHTHAPVITRSQGVTLINPGSLSQPRPMSSRPSYILMEIDREGEVHFTICYVEAWR